MNKVEIFQEIINAWLEKDMQRFLSNLTVDVRYTECYGAQYVGKVECEKWFLHWTDSAKNFVKSWEIKSAHFDEDTGFFMWTFNCVYQGKENIFDGISKVKFDGNRISEIQEFEQKHEKFRPMKG